MNKQNQIKRTLSQSDSIEYIRYRLESVGNASRTQLADEFCEHFGFFDPNGNKQSSGCLKALRALEAQGWFILPASLSRKAGQPVGQRRLDEPVPAPAALPDEAGKIEHLTLIHVTNEQQIRTWNELMIRDHPVKCDTL